MKVALARPALVSVGVAILVTCLSVLPILFVPLPPQIQIVTTGVASYKQLSSGNWDDLLPTYSPGGQTIAFVSDRSGSPSLSLMSSDGSHVTNLFSSGDVTNISNPRFGPTGSEIAFIVTFRNGSSGLIEIGTNGKGLKDLTHNIGEIETFGWSPNGQTIVYDEYQGRMWSIWLASPWNGSERILLPTVTNQGNFSYRYPSWGNNGACIVFSSNLAGHGQYNIWSFNLKSERLIQLTSGEGNDTMPSVSPDGISLSFVAYDRESATWTLWVANANGSDSHEAVSIPQDQNPGVSWVPAVSHASYPVWNPGSNGVMFFSNKSSPTSRMNANVFVYYLGINVSVYKHIGPNRRLLGDSLVPVIYGPTDIDPSWGNGGLSIVYSELGGGHYHIWIRTLAAIVPKPSYG